MIAAQAPRALEGRERADAVSEALFAIDSMYDAGYRGGPHPAAADPNLLAWTREDLPVSAFFHPGMWADAAALGGWFDAEMAGCRANGYAARVDDMESMLAEGVREPVVCAQIAGAGWMYDGHHRAGGACKRGDPTVPAYVGRPA